MDAPWYAMTDLPPGRVHVRLMWHGQAIKAARDRASSWHEYRGGDMRSLPPKGAGWPDTPERWQPIDEQSWTWPRGWHKPEPLPEDVRYRAIASAALDAADQPETVSDERRWWRDITNIRYELSGAISMHQAEGRVLRALAHCEAHRDRRTDIIDVDQSLADVAAILATVASDVDVGWIARFQPLPADHTDFLTAMGWFSALRPAAVGNDWPKVRKLTRMQRVLLMRSLDVPLSFDDIGHEFGVSGVRCRQIYRSGVQACWRVANGKMPFAATTSEAASWANQR